MNKRYFVSWVLLVLSLLSGAAVAQELSPRSNQMLRLWPGKAPGMADREPSEDVYGDSKGGVTRLARVDTPTLHLYRPSVAQPNGACVLIAPGGGYGILAISHEGTDVAVWLNSLGVTAVILKYRVPKTDPKAPHEGPLKDAQRAVRLIRQNAVAWEIDPERVGMLGFSAGGHLAVCTGASTADGKGPAAGYPAVDAADKLDPRPNFLIPIYPAYIGSGNGALEMKVTDHITKGFPPSFIAVADDDKWSLSSATLYHRLKQVGVPAEMHAYRSGGHGFGLGRSGSPSAEWPNDCAAWLKGMGFLDTQEK